MPKPVWLIEGLFEVNSLVMLAAPSATYKSFLALSWLMSMASGRSWEGRRTTPSKVLYVLGEGKASLLKRIQAWIAYHKITPDEMQKIEENFKVSFLVPQLASKTSVDNMLSELDSIQFQPTVIVIDTFARSFVGLDENSQQDTGLWIEQADRMRQLGYTVIFLHHTKKDTEFGHQYRGSSSIIGAMDTALLMTKGNDNGLLRISLSVVKQKDHEEAKPIHFRKIVVGEGGEDSCILVPTMLMDERFTKEGIEADKLLKQLMADTSFATDTARAQVLADRLNISTAAAKQRFSRLRNTELVVTQEITEKNYLQKH